ncbi:energy-coupling factor transporter transmembrane component T [Propionicicella superfundia]|uniref:energy-coupling factor transporter transmembrane component T n=1 Tax=Propionicicella superfundia TaxID=348582 RepID=UPI000686EF8E|nr:energy-coupling factor transporter transmembrane component T [Propionicicella superfundia]
MSAVSQVGDRVGEGHGARGGWLRTVNPVVKIVATLVPMVALLFTRDVLTPTLVLVGATVTLLTGFRMRPRTLAIGVLAATLIVAWMTFFFALLVDTDRFGGTERVEIGPVALYVQGLSIGLATALRFVVVMMLALLGSLGTTTDRLTSALIRQGRIPYRFAYGTAATLRFVPRYQADVRTLRAAHRARGIIDGRGPVGTLRRAGRSLVPLLAGGVRHAERLSLAMDARGFGAFPQRTDRNPAEVRTRDGVFLVAVWGGVAACYLVTARLGVLVMTGAIYQP